MRVSWFVKILIVLLTLVIGFAAYFVYEFQSVYSKPFSNNVEVLVEEGDTLNNVLNNLSTNDNLRSELFVKIIIKVFNYDTNIKPGDYSFNKNVKLDEFITTLNKGKIEDDYIKVTVPEGYSIEALGNLLENSQLNFTKEEFLNEVKKYPLPSYIRDVKERKYSLEGFLFPDTYHLDKDSTPKVVINTMLKRFEEVFKKTAEELGVEVREENIDEIITMASIVEREIIHDDERSKAASVFYNRLNVGMPLQSCATVIYSLGAHKEVLYYSDLEVDSKYNTYKYSGLPIGPISSPGKQSIIASLKPSNTDYLYFILNDDTNYHYFFNNYKDFLKQKDVRDTTLFVKK